MSQLKLNYDAIIIGAGIGGLVCGCYLAKAGMKILIVEQHDKPGGYFTSFKRGGFWFDAAAHSFGNYREGGRVRQVFEELGVDKILKIKRFDPSDIVISPDFKLTFGNDLTTTMAEFSKIFPEEKNNIINYFNFATSAKQSEFAQLKSKTYSTLLHSFFKDERIISSFALPVFGNAGLPPSLMHAFSGTKAFTESLIDGGYYPEGGMQHLPDAFDRIIKQNEGTVLYRRAVEKILVKNNSVAGIQLDNNEILNSKYVVSACDMTQTFKTLLGEEIVSEEVLKSLDQLIPSLSTFILYLGIDIPFDGLPEPGTNVWYLPHYDLEDIYNQIQNCNFAESIYMLRVSPNGKSIVAFINAPFKTDAFWKQNKKIIAENFVTRIEKLIPGIKKHVVYMDAATPASLYRYTRNYQGAAFGWAKLPSQIYDSLFNRTTFVKGLYLTGHWTSIATGMPGVCYLGYDTACRILKNENMRKDDLL